jgi:hypothetical protein
MAYSFADLGNEARSGKVLLKADRDLRLICEIRKAIDFGRDRGVDNWSTMVDVKSEHYVNNSIKRVG